MAAEPQIDVDNLILAPDILESWQAKILRHCAGELWKVCLSVIAHSYDKSLLRLMEAMFSGFQSIDAPFFCSAGKIAKSGHVCADVCTKYGAIIKMHPIFSNSVHMETVFRKLADAARLDDSDRIEMFDAIKRWVVCDYRLDPNMDRRDPDAKRLVN